MELDSTVSACLGAAGRSTVFVVLSVCGVGAISVVELDTSAATLEVSAGDEAGPLEVVVSGTIGALVVDSDFI